MFKMRKNSIVKTQDEENKENNRKNSKTILPKEEFKSANVQVYESLGLNTYETKIKPRDIN